MSTFIRRYSRYLNEKAFTYRQMAFDFARVKKGYVSLRHGGGVSGPAGTQTAAH